MIMISYNEHFHHIFGHRVIYQVKELRMRVSNFTRHFKNIFIHLIQIFLIFMKFETYANSIIYKNEHSVKNTKKY